MARLRKKSDEISPELIRRLQLKDYLGKIDDPEHEKILADRGLLRWTPLHREWRKNMQKVRSVKT